MPEISQPDFEAFYAVKPLLGKYNGADGIAKKIGDLEGDVAKERQRRQDAEGKVPKEGERVISADVTKRLDAFEALNLSPEELAGAKLLKPDDAKRLEAFDALGLKPEDVAGLQQAAEKVPTLEAEITTRDRRDARDAAARLAGFNADVLDGIKGADALTYEVKEEADPKDAKKKVRTAYVTPEGGQPVKLEEYATTNWSAFLPALKADTGTTATRTTGTEYRRDPVEGGGGGTKTAEDHAKAVRGSADYSTL